MTKNIYVSLIVPIYNAEKYLQRCLDSLSGQTLNEIEILCVNDGSTDASHEILNSYALRDPRIRVFNHQQNKGPGVARNTALDNANGTYILFCDADDTLEPDACRECCTVMESNSVDIVIFNHWVVELDRTDTTYKNSKGEYISRVRPENVGVLNRKECFKATLISSLWGVFFRFDLISRNALRFTHHKNGEDSIFLYSYLMLVQLGYALDKKLYTYYAHKGSLADLAMNKCPWLGRFKYIPRVLGATFKFALKKKRPFMGIYVFYRYFIWLQSRI